MSISAVGLAAATRFPLKRSLIRVTNRRIQSKKSLDRFPSPMGEGILDQSPLCQIAHQVAYSERPGRAFMAAPHAVGETSELCRGNGDDVAILVGEALALGVAIFDRCEHRAEEQHKTVRILMMLADRLARDIGRVAADHRRSEERRVGKGWRAGVERGGVG